MTAPVVADLNPSWRVTVCGAGLQWMLERRDGAGGLAGGRWRPAGYFVTRAALRGCSRAMAGPCDPAALAILDGLPAHFVRGAAR